MSKTNTLLIEIGTEELPPKALKKLGQAFASELYQAVVENNLLESDNGEYQWFASPRRLAVSIPGVLTQQADQTIEKLGPAIKAAYDKDGNPTPAALGFAKSCGTELDKLQTKQTDKGERLSFNQHQAGKTSAEIIPELIELANKKLPIPKRMRWGSGNAEFIRPVHWLVILHGSQLIEAEVLSVKSNTISRGHRFHSEGEIQIKNADDYASTLEQDGHVIADFDKRQAMIAEQIKQLADSVNGNITEDQALLDEVTGLVEYPAAILGDFEQDFLSVPQECLVSSMRDHQKYFHIVDKQGKLLPHFITVSNIQSKNPKQVQDGNERVLRARLSDARFFWETDLKQPLANRTNALEKVLFHIKLGSVKNKVERISQAAAGISKLISADQAMAQRSAELCKADLVSDMVGEFPELQGIMGRYYAEKDNEPAEVSQAIEQHYWPRFAGDSLPESPIAQAVSIADKLDTMIGIFAAGEEPTGDKDPYGLRRAALGILRILIEKELDVDLPTLLNICGASYEGHDNIQFNEELSNKLTDYLLDRLRAYYSSDDIQADAINSVLACRPLKPLDFDQRLRAVSSFRKLDQATNLAAANKRISNILRKSEEAIPDTVNNDALVDEAEKKLHKELDAVEDKTTQLFNQGKYNDGLELLAGLRDSVDVFFDDVMVMAEDETLRKNRLALLSRLQKLFLQVADISLLQS